jgi:Tol biopolymer transport system component
MNFSSLQCESSRSKARPLFRIAFNHRPDDEPETPTSDIYSANADGTQLEALTTDGHSRAPIWSPDGRQILYMHDSAWPSELPNPMRVPDGPWSSHTYHEWYVMTNRGEDAHRVSNGCGSAVAAAWSPDGHNILYICKCLLPQTARTGELDETGELHVIDSGGQHSRLVRKFDAPIYTAAWSPDGGTLAVDGAASPSKDSGPIAGLFLMPVYGKGAIGPIAVPGTRLAWSPNGAKLALNVFAREQDAYSGVGVINADGSHLIQLTDEHRFRNAALPAWSPDGRQIAFEASTEMQHAARIADQQIFIMNADGSGQRQLTHDRDWDCGNPSWSPDGNELAFSCDLATIPCPAAMPSSGRKLTPECTVRRIFVLSLKEPNAKPVQITKINGSSPVFAPVP